MTLSLISAEVGLVPAGAPPHAAVAGSSKSDFGYVLTPQIQSTHSFANAPALDILFVPGGLGIVALEQNNDTTIEDFIAKRYAKLDYLVGVSLGVVGLAKSGVLKGKRATTNKSAWTYVTTTPGHGENITWVPQARWVVDGNIWTTSGIAAGLDAAYALLKQIYGTESLDYMMNVIEYAPHTNPAWDPYAAVFNVSYQTELQLYTFLMCVSRFRGQILIQRWLIVLLRWHEMFLPSTKMINAVRTSQIESETAI